MSETETETTTLRQRIVQNPRPAQRWLIGLAVLVLLELGRFADGLLNIGNVIKLLVTGVTGGVALLASMIGDLTIGIVGSLAYIVLSVLVLAAFSDPIRERLPVSPAKQAGIDRSPNQRIFADRAIVTAGLGIIMLALAATPVGTAFDTLVELCISGLESISSIPTITDRDLISNQGYRNPNGSGWVGTFLGLSPAIAWAIRVFVVHAYAFALLYWLWRGYLTYRAHYRALDWSPIDDSINAMRSHAWGKAGLIVVVLFVIMAIWAPTLGPVTAEENIYEPYQHETKYLGENGEVKTITHGAANIETISNRASNVPPMSYDKYGRFAPLGTNTAGKDLYTFLAYGARTSLVIGLLAIGLSAGFALAMAMITAYYKGLVDFITILATDTIQGVPGFLMILMLMTVFKSANNPLVNIYGGGILLALILAFVYWPGIWRSIRGPSLQIAEAEWIDAAKSFGQRPSVIMRKHMAPYVLVYLLIYASLLLGGVIIQTAALSFLGVGLQPPTPEWGRMINNGRGFVDTRSWHVATIPGIFIVLVVTGFNALGDAIRDALDVQAEEGGGGGGA